MDTARERSTDQTVTPQDIAARIAADPSARDHYRKDAGTLECPKCQGTAWFITKRTSGQGNAFGAHHAENCELASSRPTSEPGELDTPAPALEHQDDGVLILDSTPLGQTTGTAATRPAADGEDTEGRGGRRHDAAHGTGTTHDHQINLRPLLAHLVTEPHWLRNNGTRRVRLPGRGDPFLADAVWSMDDFDPEDERRGKLMICWGRVHNVRPAYGRIYFNQGLAATSTGSISLTEADALALAAQYAGHDITSPYGFSGAHIIAVGRPVGTRNNRLSVEPERDARGNLQVAIHLPRTS